VPRGVLSSVPGVGEVELQNFEDALFAPTGMTQKKYKQLVKNFMQTFVIGLNLEYNRKRHGTAHVLDLPETLSKLSSKRDGVEPPNPDDTSFLFAEVFPE
jgi:hypothetical protein